jgi:MFS family permease
MDSADGELAFAGSTASLESISGHAVRVTNTQLAVIAASLGTAFEWYDFFLYGTLAVFFSALFFPPGNETAAFLASLATFGAGFAVRPIGALVFGALGDRIGRKKTFMVTMVMMGVSTPLPLGCCRPMRR